MLCCAVWHATCGTRRLGQAAPKQSPMPSEILCDFSRIMRAQRRQPATTKGATTTATTRTTTSSRRTTEISLSAHLHTYIIRSSVAVGAQWRRQGGVFGINIVRGDFMKHILKLIWNDIFVCFHTEFKINNIKILHEFLN